MSPYEYQWFVLENVKADTVSADTLPTITITQWEDVIGSGVRHELEQTMLPAYLARDSFPVLQFFQSHSEPLTL